MRRGHFTTEFWATLFLMGYLYITQDPWHRSVCFSALACAYIISRLFFKRNRGQFHPAWQSTEIVVYVLAQIVCMFTIKELWYLLLINHAVYALERGRIKGLGVITQYIHR